LTAKRLRPGIERAGDAGKPGCEWFAQQQFPILKVKEFYSGCNAVPGSAAGERFALAIFAISGNG